MNQLQQYIQAQNESFVKECKARGAVAYFTTVEDPAHWAEFGVYTVEDYTKFQLAAAIADLSKSAYGYKNRVDWKTTSLEELERLEDSYARAAEEAYEMEKDQEEKDLASFKESISKYISLGAGDEETALRWMVQDESFYNGQDVEHWVWSQGILFTDFGRELVNKINSLVEWKEYEPECI